MSDKIKRVVGNGTHTRSSYRLLVYWGEDKEAVAEGVRGEGTTLRSFIAGVAYVEGLDKGKTRDSWLARSRLTSWHTNQQRNEPSHGPSCLVTVTRPVDS